MLRKCVFLSVVMVMILSLFACGGGAAPMEEEDEEEVVEDVTSVEEEVTPPEEEEIIEEEVAPPEEPTPSADLSSMIEYVSPDHLYSVWFPETWEIIPVGTNMIRASTKAKVNGIPETSVSVWLDDMGSDTAKESCEQALIALRDNPDLQLAETQQVEIGDSTSNNIYYAGYKIVYTQKEPTNIKGIILLTARECEKVYYITSVSPEAIFDDYQSEIESIINSFVFQVPPPCWTFPPKETPPPTSPLADNIPGVIDGQAHVVLIELWDLLYDAIGDELALVDGFVSTSVPNKVTEVELYCELTESVQTATVKQSIREIIESTGTKVEEASGEGLSLEGLPLYGRLFSGSAKVGAGKLAIILETPEVVPPVDSVEEGVRFLESLLEGLPQQEAALVSWISSVRSALSNSQGAGIQISYSITEKLDELDEMFLAFRPRLIEKEIGYSSPSIGEIHLSDVVIGSHLYRESAVYLHEPYPPMEGIINITLLLGGHPIWMCLEADTLIDTPNGQIQIKDIHQGMAVWTADESGLRHPAVIEKVVRVRVPFGHQLVHLILDDGRELFASPGHPTADGRTLGRLLPGDTIDGARVVSIDTVLYQKMVTYDILTSGNTGFYWADGILIGSTLIPPKENAK